MNDINIGNTSYSVESQWLQLVDKYFPNENISLNKAGLFGYLNEIMANEVKNNIYHRNFIYDEYLLNTASTPKAIYNFAKNSNVAVDTASPARVSVNLSILKDDIINSSNFIKMENEGSDSVSKFVLSRSVNFYIKGKNFLLPYDVELLFTYNNVTKEYVVTAHYDITHNAFPYYTMVDPYIKTWEMNLDGDKFLFLKLELFQLSLKSKTLMITSQDITETSFHKFSYSGQLAYFEVYYSKDNNTELLPAIFNDGYSLKNGEKYCYYNLLDDSNLEITFASVFNSFKPEYNSTLRADIYVTEGKAGNFSLTGDMEVTYNSNEKLNNIPMYITPLTDCSGGKDVPTLLELKKKIIDKNLSRNCIVTDDDLDRFFNNITISERLNSSHIKFLKKRSDILRRVYSAFLLLKDTNSMTIPTRTLDTLKISESQLKEINGMIPETSIIVYDIKAKSYFLVTRELELKKYKDNENYLIYSIPYLISLTCDDFIRCDYYKTFIHKYINMKSKYTNPAIPHNFIITQFSIDRNSLVDDSYKLNLYLATNLLINSSNENKLIVRGILKDRSGKPYGYFDFNKVSENDLLYEANLSTEKYDVIRNGKLNIYNSIYKIDSMPGLDNNGDTSYKNCRIDSDVLIDIQILYKSEMSSHKFGEASLMPDLILAGDEQYSSCAVFTHDDTIKLFEDIHTIIDSLLIPTDGSNGLTIKSVPLIEYNYIHNNLETVYNLLDNYISILTTNIDKLENNTELDLKFYNTHGPAIQHCSSIDYDTSISDFKYNTIKRIDMQLALDIYLNSSITSEMNTMIQSYISAFIESCNSNGVFPLSNLTRGLEEQFGIIEFIEIKGINDEPIQKVIDRNKNPETLNIDDFYVPEYLNLRKKLTVTKNDNVTEKSFKYDITINYK